MDGKRVWLLLVPLLLSGCGTRTAEVTVPDVPEKPPAAEEQPAAPSGSLQPEPPQEEQTGPVQRAAPPEQPLEAVCYGEAGEVTYTTTYFYDEAGRCVLEREEWEKTDNVMEETVYETVNTYDERGNLICVSHWEGGVEDGYILSQRNYTYDEDGWLTQVHSDWNGLPDSDEVYTYDARGWKTSMEQTFYQNGDHGWHRITVTYTYDEAGRLLREEKNDQWLNGDKEKTFQSWTAYEYDGEGRLIEARQDNGVRNLYFYDAHGNCVEDQCLYDDDALIYATLYEYGPIQEPNKYTSQQGGATINE